MKIAITANKGGVGKSFAAIILTQLALAHERSVTLIDVDPQKNAFAALDGLTSATVMATEGRSPKLDKYGFADDDFVILDTPRSCESAGARSAIEQSDLVVIPVRTEAFAIAGMKEALALAQSYEKPYLILLMLPVKVSSSSQKMIDELVKEFGKKLIQWPSSELASRNIESRKDFYKGMRESSYDRFDALYKIISKIERSK